MTIQSSSAKGCTSIGYHQLRPIRWTKDLWRLIVAAVVVGVCPEGCTETQT